MKKRLHKRDFISAEDSISITPGEMLATLRNLQGLTQNGLAKLTGMTQANISSMESGRQQIGRDRALALAKALKVHPAVIMFPNYRVEDEAA
jgi:transcriptional regulator with XRE-family HTH domain